jgi:hypothetical protein
MMNGALRQEEVCSCAFLSLAMVSLRNPWVMKAHESLFSWNQRAFPVHDAARDAFMLLPPHNTSREDDVRLVVEGARTGRKSR